jgi:hypothetical protein
MDQRRQAPGVARHRPRPLNVSVLIVWCDVLARVKSLLLVIACRCGFVFLKQPRSQPPSGVLNGGGKTQVAGCLHVFWAPCSIIDVAGMTKEKNHRYWDPFASLSPSFWLFCVLPFLCVHARSWVQTSLRSNRTLPNDLNVDSTFPFSSRTHTHTHAVNRILGSQDAYGFPYQSFNYPPPFFSFHP